MPCSKHGRLPLGGSALNEVWEWVIEDRRVSGGAGGW